MGRLVVACWCLGVLSGCEHESSEAPLDGGPDSGMISRPIPSERKAVVGAPDAGTLPPSCPPRAGDDEIDKPVVAPVSLTASDGTGLILKRLRARAVIDAPLAFTELTIEFQNPTNRELEGRFEVIVPDRAAISRFAMRIGDRWQEAEVVEKMAARVAYEDFLHRNQDPALLEKSAGNRFRARVFPIPPGGIKRFILSYSEELDDRCEPYRLMLKGLPRIDEIEVGINRGAGERVVLEARDFAPDSDLTVPVEATAATGLRFDHLVAARVTPARVDTQDPVESLTVLFDTSFSRRPGFEKKVARLGALVRSLLSHSTVDFHLRVICFDQTMEVVFDDVAGRLNEAALSAIRNRGALGASNFEMLLDYLSRQPEVDERVVILTDGIATAGMRDAGAIRRAAAELPWRGVARVDAVVDDSARDDQMLLALTRAGFASNGVVIDGALPVDRIARRILSAVRSDVAIRVPGATWVWPQSVRSLQPGDSVLVYASLPPGEALRVEMDEIGFKAAVPLRPAERPLLERAWVKADIDRLQAMIGDEGVDDSALRDEILHLSRTYRVLSDHTALLVLETAADYQRFDIDRKALADILVVSEKGIDVLQRTDAVLSGGGLGSLQGNEIGESFGYGGLGLRGEGRGGGGNGEGTIGLGNLNTIGHGGVGMLTRRRAMVPRIRSSAAMVRGSLSKDVIKRVLDRRRNELRSCYNRLLLSDPEAGGRVRVRFAISRTGRVAAAGIADSFIEDDAFQQCINSSIAAWEFPSVPDSGVVIVTYPIVFTTEDRPNGEALPDEEVPTTGERDELLTMIDEHIDLELDLERLAELDRKFDAVRLPEIEDELNVPLLPAPAPDAGAARGIPDGGSPTPDTVSEAGTAEGDIPALTSVTEKISLDRPPKENAYSGTFAVVVKQIRRGRVDDALETARQWQDASPGNVLALIALGEALEAAGDPSRAARVYGSLIDLHPSRAEMLRMTGGRLERLGDQTIALAVDVYENAVRERPDHPSGHRLLAFALLKAGNPERAFNVMRDAVSRKYPRDRFAGVRRIMREDLALIGAVWAARQPEQEGRILEMMKRLRLRPARRPSTRFVLSWESDANDVDLHIFDGRFNHVSYANRELASGGTLYADVTTGFGPECVTIHGRPRAYPYTLQAHYYRRGPMGYGMGKLQIVRHDGKGGLAFSERPFVIMRDNAYVDLGTLRRSSTLTAI